MALIIYFAGFATAIYFLAPVTETPRKSRLLAKRSETNSETRQFAIAFNGKMRETLSFAAEKAAELGQVIKTELAE